MVDQLSLWDILNGLLQAIWASLTFNTQAFEFVLNAPNVRIVSVLVLVLAGLSHLVGQAIVLVINRAPPKARVRALFLGTLLMVVEFLFWMAAIWLLAGVLFGTWQPLLVAFRVLSIAYAPMLLGFVVLIPYAGPGLFQALRLWTLLSVTVATSVAFSLSLFPAAICAIGGWFGHYLIVQAITRVTGTGERRKKPAVAPPLNLVPLVDQKESQGGHR